MKRKIDIYGSSSQEETNNPYSKYTNNSHDTASSSINPYTGNAYTSRYYEILQKRRQLPVYEFKDELIKNVR